MAAKARRALSMAFPTYKHGSLETCTLVVARQAGGEQGQRTQLAPKRRQGVPSLVP